MWQQWKINTKTLWYLSPPQTGLGACQSSHSIICTSLSKHLSYFLFNTLSLKSIVKSYCILCTKHHYNPMSTQLIPIVWLNVLFIKLPLKILNHNTPLVKCYIIKYLRGNCRKEVTKKRGGELGRMEYNQIHMDSCYFGFTNPLLLITIPHSMPNASRISIRES